MVSYCIVHSMRFFFDNILDKSREQTCIYDNHDYIEGYGPNFKFLMLHRRFANVTQVPFCKSNWWELETMKNEPNHTHIH